MYLISAKGLNVLMMMSNIQWINIFQHRATFTTYNIQKMFKQIHPINVFGILFTKLVSELQSDRDEHLSTMSFSVPKVVQGSY